MRTIVKNYLKVLLILLLWVPPLSVLALGISEVQRGDNVILIKPMSDGVTYYVQTPNGLEVWKDRDLYYFAGYQESCTVTEDKCSGLAVDSGRRCTACDRARC